MSDESTECLHGLGETGEEHHRGFEWIGASATQTQYESPAVIAEFQRRLRDAAIRRAELQIAQEEEKLRASREANRLNEEALSKEIKQGSRSNTVSFLRSIVLLVALTWMLAILSLSMVGAPAAAQLTPGAVIRYATKLIDGAEAAGVRRSQRRGQVAVYGTRDAIEGYLEVMHEDDLPIPSVHRDRVAVHAA